MSQPKDNSIPAEASSNRRSNGTFAPGISGNPAGRSVKPTPNIAHRFRAFMDEPDALDPKRKNLEAMMSELRELARAGNVTAYKLLFDRSFGPVPDAPPEESHEDDEQQQFLRYLDAAPKRRSEYVEFLLSEQGQN